MNSTQIALHNNTYHFDRTLTTIKVPDNKTSPVSVTRTAQSPNSLSRNQSVTNAEVIPHTGTMSLAFREVFQDFSSKLKESKLAVPDSLLYSSDNMRPKSRSKTENDLQDVVSVDKNKSGHFISKTPVLQTRNYEDNMDSSPVSSKELPNCSSNAVDGLIGRNENQSRKGKKSRKRTNSSSKNKKGKHGRQLAASTGLQLLADKRISVPAINPTGQGTKTSRVSSEPPPSKISAKSMFSYMQEDQEHQLHKPFVLPSDTNQQSHSICTSAISSAKSNSTHCRNDNSMHGNSETVLLNGTMPEELFAHGSSVTIYKLELGHRVKSASSHKTLNLTAPNTESMKNSDSTAISNELTLNSVPCTLQQANRPIKPVLKSQNRTHSEQGSLKESNDLKLSVLASIYGTVYETADKVTTQAESLKKVKKIYLSDKQSGTIKENGMEFPCAPPATPTPDALRNHEFIPSMSDVRSQRAVKGRLQAMEKEAHKKHEKQKDSNAKLQKQLQKDKEKMLKTKQRREIYALNKVMTELENRRFLEFCQLKGLNKV